MTASGRRNFFYKRISLSVSDFPDEAQAIFGFQATRVIIVNDGLDSTLTFSFSRPHIDGELFEDDGPLVFDGLGAGKVWLKSSAETQVRVWAWRI